MIGVGLSGILLIGVGITLYRRDRARLHQQEIGESEGPIEEDALGKDRNNIMDAMIALDDQYTAGGIPRKHMKSAVWS